MSKLEDFLGLVDVSEIRQTISVELGGKKLELVIRPLTDQEHQNIQKRCQVMVKNKMVFDTGKYNECILEACIVEPNFNEASFLNKVGCMTSTEFLKRKFPAGVLMDIGSQIQTLSGFETIELEVDEAKN